jgi:flagellar L-ring protein precursor FlgH
VKPAAWISPVLALTLPLAAQAQDRHVAGSFSALASDRTAHAVGDLLTVLVYQSAQATNSATSGSRRSTKLTGSISAGDANHSGFDKQSSLGLDGQSDNSGTSERSNQIVTQMSATVDGVLPNGDLLISGSQMLNVNGEHTLIRIKGRVRSADVSASNTIISSRLADAMIDYNGKGFVSRSGRPGIVSRLFSFLGIL